MAGKVLFIDLPGHKPLPPISSLKISSGVDTEFHSVTDINAAVSSLSNIDNLDIVICNSPQKKIFELARKLKHPLCTILITNAPMSDYSQALDGQEDYLIDHIIANKSDLEWTVLELRVTLQKIIRQDIFGLEKYLSPSAKIYQQTIKSSQDREKYNVEVMRFAQQNHLGQYIAKMAFGITEELLMNAVYDAPVTQDHRKFLNLPRATPVELQPNEYAKLTYGCDGQIFGIAASDPFGALERSKVFEYLRKVLLRRDSNQLIDSKKGGAGLGLFKILYSSHALICNVKPQEKTEIIALIDVQDQLRDFSKSARSIHYFKCA